MKIVFIGLITHYTTGLMYQPNSFNKILLKNGYEVTFISDLQYFDKGELKFSNPCDYIDEDGVRLIRIPYLISNSIGSKLKLFNSIYHYLEDIKPDIIYCHSPQYFSVFDIIKYKKNHPNVLVYADTHTGYYNVNASKWYFPLLYKVYYKKIYKTLEPYLEKYFYIGSSDKEFSENIFDADTSKMFFLPLGGNAIRDADYELYRSVKRDELKIRNNDILLVHSGKLDEKKNTNWLIEIINSINDDKLKLAIIGSIPSSNKKLYDMIEKNSNKNIYYLGWKDSNELLKYICASDIYVQPGSPSVTLNNSICSQTPVIAYKYDLYSEFFDISSICWVKNKEELEVNLRKLLSNKSILINFKQEAKKNKYLLDYKTNLLRELKLGDK